MNLRLLRYFAVLAEELHFGRAAVRLHISQPPLSQQIRLLEEEIGAALFIRGQRRVELTPAGLALKEHVPQVFLHVDRSLDAARQAARGHLGRLLIGMVSSAMLGPIPRALWTFHNRYPNVSWELREEAPLEQLAGLREQRLDVCFLRSEQEDAALTSEPLFRERIMVVLPERHHLATRAELRLSDLAPESFVLFESGKSQFADFLRECCRLAGFTPRIRQQAVDVHTLLSLVREGFGVALLPASSRNFGHVGLVYCALADPVPESALYAIYRKEDPSSVLQLFLQTIRDVADEQLTRNQDPMA